MNLSFKRRIYDILLMLEGLGYISVYGDNKCISLDLIIPIPK
jgi:hypothetical protein